MNLLTNLELMNIVGGGISGSMVNAFLRGIGILIDIGRSIGTAIRRIQTGKYC